MTLTLPPTESITPCLQAAGQFLSGAVAPIITVTVWVFPSAKTGSSAPEKSWPSTVTERTPDETPSGFCTSI